MTRLKATRYISGEAFWHCSFIFGTLPHKFEISKYPWILLSILSQGDCCALFRLLCLILQSRSWLQIESQDICSSSNFFPFSQGTQFCTASYATSEDSYFVYFTQFYSCLLWKAGWISVFVIFGNINPQLPADILSLILGGGENVLSHDFIGGYMTIYLSESIDTWEHSLY